MTEVRRITRQIKLCGTLDMLRVSTQGFGIRLQSGEEAPGVLVRGDVCDLKDLLNRRVTVYGRAVYRPSGRLLRIDADEIVPATDKDQFFARIPEVTPPNRNLKQRINQQATGRGIEAIIGKWPGDETDEQIYEVLDRLSSRSIGAYETPNPQERNRRNENPGTTPLSWCSTDADRSAQVL